MKTLIVILIIASLIQTAILPIDLVLLILICHSFIKSGRENLYLAFSFGLLVSFLTQSPLGLLSLIYIIIIQLTQILSRSRLAGNPWLIIPISFVFLSLNKFAISQAVFIETILSLPILYVLKIWEERFIVKKGIKLKV